MRGRGDFLLWRGDADGAVPRQGGIAERFQAVLKGRRRGLQGTETIQREILKNFSLQCL